LLIKFRMLMIDSKLIWPLHLVEHTIFYLLVINFHLLLHIIFVSHLFEI
jgi:hypothetical protein